MHFDRSWPSFANCLANKRVCLCVVVGRKANFGVRERKQATKWSRSSQDSPVRCSFVVLFFGGSPLMRNFFVFAHMGIEIDVVLYLGKRLCRNDYLRILPMCNRACLILFLFFQFFQLDLGFSRFLHVFVHSLECFYRWVLVENSSAFHPCHFKFLHCCQSSWISSLVLPWYNNLTVPLRPVCLLLVPTSHSFNSWLRWSTGPNQKLECTWQRFSERDAHRSNNVSLLVHNFSDFG